MDPGENRLVFLIRPVSGRGANHSYHSEQFLSCTGKTGPGGRFLRKNRHLFHPAGYV